MANDHRVTSNEDLMRAMRPVNVTDDKSAAYAVRVTDTRTHRAGPDFSGFMKHEVLGPQSVMALQSGKVRQALAPLLKPRAALMVRMIVGALGRSKTKRDEEEGGRAPREYLPSREAIKARMEALEAKTTKMVEAAEKVSPSPTEEDIRWLALDLANGSITLPRHAQVALTVSLFEGAPETIATALTVPGVGTWTVAELLVKGLVKGKRWQHHVLAKIAASAPDRVAGWRGPREDMLDKQRASQAKYHWLWYAR